MKLPLPDIFARGRFQAQSAPPPDRTAPIAEAVVIACIGVVVLAVPATNDRLLMLLDKLPSAFFRAHVIVAICAVACILLAMAVTLFWRTAVGIFLMVPIVIAYTMTLKDPASILRWLPKTKASLPVIELGIDIQRSNVLDAEMWMNGVYVGKTPLVTTLREIEAKVPLWESPPEGLRTGTDYVRVFENAKWYTMCTWFDFNLRRRRYWARFRLDDEWARGTGAVGDTGGGDDVYVAQGVWRFYVVFPGRQKRLKLLLDRARLTGSRVGEEWFKAMETFGDDGWIALRKAAEAEPEMLNILDAWATWRYKLDTITDSRSAWEVFEQICDEADSQKCYFTASVAGRAVELIIDRLDPKRLAKRAERIIRRAPFSPYRCRWQMNGRWQFGYVYRPGGFFNGTQDIDGGPTVLAWLSAPPALPNACLCRCSCHLGAGSASRCNRRDPAQHR